MKAKEYLKNIEKIDRLIEEKLLQKDDLRNMKITASIDGMPRGSGGSSDKIGNAVAKIGEIEEEIVRKLDELVTLKLEATGYINKLDVQENLLLDMRYIRGLEWKVIADEFCYEERNVHRLHSKALNRLDEILEKHVRKCQ